MTELPEVERKTVMYAVPCGSGDVGCNRTGLGRWKMTLLHQNKVENDITAPDWVENDVTAPELGRK